MKAGKLRWPITIQQRGTPTQDPVSGEITYGTPSTFASVMADMATSARSGSRSVWEMVVAQQTIARRVVQFDVRFIPGVDETMRIVDYEGKVWDIKAIVDVETRHRELWLVCEMGLTAG